MTGFDIAMGIIMAIFLILLWAGAFAAIWFGGYMQGWNRGWDQAIAHRDKVARETKAAEAAATVAEAAGETATRACPELNSSGY